MTKTKSNMKKTLLMTLVLAFFAMFQGYSQTQIVESFEGAWPPTGWTITGFTQNVARGYDGTKSADCNYSTSDGRIILPSYVCSEYTTFSFYVGTAFHSYSSSNVFTVEVSTSIDNPSWQTIQNISYPTNDDDFLYNEINLSAYAGQEILVSLHVVPNYGANTVVDLVSLYEMNCPKPTNFVASNVTISSAELSWNAVTEANEYVLEIVSGSEDWTNATTHTLTTTTFSMTDLTPATIYYARVKSLCEEDQESTYSSVVTIATPCAESISTLPFEDQFNNLNCWTVMIEGNYGGYPYPEIGEEFSGMGNMLQTGADAMIALSSPLEFDVTQVEFIFPLRAYEGNATPVAQVGYVTSLTDTTSYVPMATWQIQNADHWAEYILNTSDWVLDEDSTYYIAIKFMTGTYGSMYFDNFKIQQMPDCPAPVRTSVSVSANATNAIVTWVDNNPEHEAWTVYYRETNAEEGTDWLEESATEQQVTLTGLTPETTYDVFVKTDCGTGDDNTDQTYTVSFTTTPAPITLPYFQDFEDEDAGSEFSYHTYDWYDERNEWKIGSATAYLEEGETSGRSMYISSDNGATHSYVNTYCFSMASLLVEFAPGYEYSLEFDYLVNGEQNSDIFRVFILDAGLPLEQYYNGAYLSNELSGTTSWSHFSAGIPTEFIGTTKQIIFYWKNDSYTVNQPPAAIDNIRITPTTCVRPSEITITEITSSTATIAWQGSADQYVLEYYPTSNPTEVETIETSLTSTTLTDLTTATSYTFRLYSVCDEEQSPVTPTYSFFTSCGAITEPFWFEDFESVLGNEDAANLKFACWNVMHATGGSYNGSFPRIYWEGYGPSAHSGEVTLEFKGDGLLLLPEFATSTDELQLSFYANTTASTPEAAGIFEVGYVTDATDTASFVPVTTVAPVGLARSSSVLVGPFVFTDAPDDARIALRYKAVLVANLESWNLDDFTVQPVSECPAPNFSSVTVTDVTDSEATISWVDEDATHSQWKVFYKTLTEETYSEVTATSQSVTITGLVPATRYSVYVQTDCGTENNYDRTAEVSFSTRALPVSVFPFEQDFQDLESNPFNAEFYGSGMNQWTIGSAVGAVSEEDAISVYVSNNQADYTYTTNNTSYSFIVIPVQFGDASEYTISFDYKVGGEPNYDYLSVALCDGNTSITNSTTSLPTGTVILNKATETEWTTATYTTSTLAGAYKLLVFYWTNDYGGGNSIPAALDNIRIIGSNCPSPESFALVSKTSTEATFSWIAPEDFSSWTLYYKEATQTEYTPVDVTENPFTLTGLDPQTGYAVYIATNCVGEESAPSATISFTTDCDAISEFPYFEGFETNSFGCWEGEIVQSNGNDNNWSIESATEYNPIEGNKFAIFQASGNASARLVSPMFDMTDLTSPYVKFDYVNRDWSGDQDVLTVQYRSSLSEPWTTIGTYATNVSSWLTDSIALPSHSDTYQISFLGVSNYGYGTAVDAIYVYDASGEQGGTDPEPEPCDAPTNLTVSNITENSADVSWNGTATTYELRLNSGEAETLTSTSKQLIGLPDNFTITVEVRAICESQVSEWVSTTFTTLAAQGGTDPDTQPCEPPTALLASNITETTAEITWNGTATTYELRLNSGEAETLTTTTKSLTDLTPNTAYTVEVRAICESQASAWVSTTFTTLNQVEITLAEVTTSPATEVGNTSATLNGALVNAGNSENIAVGFALATVADFTLEDAGVENITATLSDATFSQVVTDLVEGQTYFYRAYATNEVGTAYGAVETFTLSGLTDALANALTATIYPNPASDKATLRVEGLQSDAKIVISDLQGRILSQGEIKANEKTYTINASELSSGVYYIRIVADSVVSTQKLIVE